MKKNVLYLRISIICLLLITALVQLNAQNFIECAYIDDTTSPQALRSGCDNSSSTWITKYRSPGYWVPNDNTPIKTIMVNWVVCRDDNGLNGWQDIPEFHEQVDLMFSHINEWYSNSQPKGYSLTCEPNYTHVYDTKIRFELNEIIFIDNTEFNNNCWAANDLLDYIYQTYPGSEDIFTHIFTQPSSPCLGGAWGYYNTYTKNNTAYVQTWGSMWSPWFVVWDDHINHITHEYGHAVGLHHTYDGEYRCTTHYDFLDDVFGLCAEPTCAPCSAPPNCNGDHVCYFNAGCFWDNQNQPFPLMSGNNNSRYISPKSGGRMHRALSLYNNIFKVNNKPMHRYVKEDHSFYLPLTILENEVWDFSIKMYQDIIIEAGKTLTISCEVKMPIDGKIIVKQGAHLIVDGGHVTTAHSHPWQGIQVWGNKSESQYTLPGELCEQGKLTLINGATIENAIVAVDLWKPGDYSTSGGIVDATDATLRNNAQAVHAMPYRNISPFNPIAELNNLSNFKYCTFEITEDYLGDETFYRHVDMAQVKGIDFEACSFSLAENVEGVSTWNSAITGFDAQFSVKGVCTSNQLPCPEENYARSSFTGFYAAVNALNDGGSQVSFSVSRADVTNNVNGVKTRNMNNASVLFSNFEIGHLWDCGTGIHSDNVTGFAFEENNFSKFTGAPVSDYFGIIINNSEAANEVYKNTFTGLSYANFSDGKNWFRDNRYLGLTYYCNENSNNYADFYVADKNTNHSDHSGIQSEQGGNSYTAGNTFTQNGATWHFYNGGEHLVGYYHNLYTGNETPDDDKIFHVAKIGRIVANACPSHYGGSGGIDLLLSPQQKADAEQTYYTNLTNYNSIQTLYDSYVDGGNTDATLIDIQTAQPDDMWELRSKLLGESPHLSFDVLKEAADKTDVFTESALFDILAANPDELKKDTLISYLENKENPLPGYMIDLLKQLAEGTTYKTALQQQMAGYKHSYSRAANDIIRSILHDTIVDNTALRNWLDNLGGITSDRQIISTYISEGNFTDALTLANMLPQLYKLEDNELAEHAYYIDMLGLHQTLYLQGRNIFQLDSTEKATITFIAANSTGVAGAQAKSILEGVYDNNYVDCPEADGAAGYKQSRIINSDALAKAHGLLISVKPNPANNWAAFDFTLPGDATEATITIANSMGTTVEILQLSGQQGQKIWDTRKVNPGVYIYTLTVSSFSQSGKIVINK